MRRPSHDRHRRAHACAIALACAPLALASSVAHADVELDTTRVEARCPDAAALRAAIVARLSRDPFSGDDAAALSITIAPGSVSPGLEAHIELVPSAGAPPESRTIASASGDCAALIRAAALAVAVALDRDEPPAVPPPRPTEPASTPRAAARAPEADQTAASNDRRERAIVGANAITQVGLAPRPSTGAALEARARLSATSFLAIRGVYLPPSAMPQREFSLSLVGGSVGGCVEPWASQSVTPYGCVHALAGAQTVHDAAIAVGRNSAFFAGASAAAGARVRVAGPVSATAQAEGIVPFTRPIFATVWCPSTGFEAPVAALGVSLGLAVTIW